MPLCRILVFLCFSSGLAAQGVLPPTTISPWVKNPGVNSAHGTDWGYMNLIPHPTQPGKFIASHTAYLGNIELRQGGVGDWDLTTGIYDANKKTFTPDKLNLAVGLNSASMDCCHVLLPGGPRAGLLGVYEWVDGGMDDTWVYNSNLTPPTWTKIRTLVNPSKRYRHAMAYMGNNTKGSTILFGGSIYDPLQTRINYFDDTWSWNGTTWKQQKTLVRPPARDFHAMAYDAARNRVVLFGGWNGKALLGDTWEWDGLVWRKITTPVAPSPRKATAMTYDSTRSRIVLFGGNDGNINLLQDTWEYNGSWVRIRPTTMAIPISRCRHSMAFDASQNQVVLFGGMDNGIPAITTPGIGRRANRELQDTWVWNGLAWRNVSPQQTAIRGRYQHSMAYDPGIKKVVLFGGYGPTWPHWSHGEWDGSTSATTPAWTDLTNTLGNNRPLTCFAATGPFPVGRSDHAMAFDAARKKVVLFGGNGMPYRFTTPNGTSARKVFLVSRPTLTSPWKITGAIQNLPWPSQNQYWYDPAIAYYEFTKGRQELVLIYTLFRANGLDADIVMAPLNPTTLQLNLTRQRTLVRVTTSGDQANSSNPVVDGKGNIISLNCAIMVNQGATSNLYFAGDLDPNTPANAYHIAGPYNSNGAYAGGTFFAGEMTWAPFNYLIHSIDTVWWTGGNAWRGQNMELRVQTPAGEMWNSLILISSGFLGLGKTISLPPINGQLGLLPTWIMPFTSSKMCNPATGRTTWQIPIPNNPVLMGATICGQSASLFIGPPTKTALGNTATMTIR